MIQVLIYYSTHLWVLYEAWITSWRGGSPHSQQYDLFQLYPSHDHLLHWLWDPKSWTIYLHQWCGDPRIMVQVWICYFTVLWELDEVCDIFVVKWGHVFVGTKELPGGATLEYKDEICVMSHNRYTTRLSMNRGTHSLMFWRVMARSTLSTQTLSLRIRWHLACQLDILHTIKNILPYK